MLSLSEQIRNVMEKTCWGMDVPPQWADEVAQLEALVDEYKPHVDGLYATVKRRVQRIDELEAENDSLRQLHTAQMEENERLWAIRDSLDDLLEPDEPHDLGGPHISIPWVIARFDALKEGDDAD